MRQSVERQITKIRQIGILNTIKQALFDIPQPEFDFQPRREVR
jgi:hypothetical protein